MSTDLALDLLEFDELLDEGDVFVVDSWGVGGRVHYCCGRGVERMEVWDMSS